jgi:hypothetical protein
VPKKYYLLVSSNLGTANNLRPFHERIQLEKRLGYYERDSKMFWEKFGAIAEEYRMTVAFIKAINHLALSNNEYDIVLRPHPVENIEAWKVYLDGVPNVHVVRDGSITPWINNAFALMHNGCTSALEAAVSGKPIVSYVPFEQEYEREIPNELGVRVGSLETLSAAVNELFEFSRTQEISESEEALPSVIAKKIYLSHTQLAAEKIVEVWESLENGKVSGLNNWRKIQGYLKLLEIKRVIGGMIRNAFPHKFEPAKENSKFPPMDIGDIRDRVSRFQRILNIDRKIECYKLAERTVLVRPQ